MDKTLQTRLEQAELAAKLKGSLLLFIQAFFPILTGRDFIVSKPIGRESHFITICRALTKCTRLQALRLLVNVPPGHGKSIMVSFWIAWCYAKWPDCNFLYISYSKTLATSHTENIKRIMSLSQYKTLFNVRLREDSQAKDAFTTEAGGTVASFGSAGAITGRNAGLPGLDRFSGAVLCFPYDEYVQTEIGAIKIGEIVDKKLDVKVYSVNLETREIQLKPIIGHFQNPGSPIIEVEFNDGAIIRCTPDHKIWTDNRGWIEAQDLLATDELFTPTPDGSLRKIQYFGNLTLRDTQISQNFQLPVSKASKFASHNALSNYFSSLFSFKSTTISASYFLHSQIKYIKFFSQFFRTERTENDFNNVLGRKFGTGMLFAHRKGSMINRILNILCSCTIAKIFRSIVGSNPIYMPNIMPIRLRTVESPCDQLMGKNISLNRITCNSSPIIFPRGIKGKFLDFLRLYAVTSIVAIINSALFRANSSKAGCAIKSIKPRNKSPLFIRHIGHVDKSYCINVESNHNFFCGTSEDNYTLVQNCDDMHKPDEVHSDLVRESVITNFRETIQQRPRGINVPIVFIGQRLHEQDLPAYFIAGEDGYEWDKVILKSLDDAGNALYPEAFPKEMLLIRQEKDRYVFAAQHQQDPQPAGGGLYMPEDFPLLAEEPEFSMTFITADTAETEDPRNDATVFSFWGLYNIETQGRKTGIMGLHWLACREMRVEPKRLENEFLDFWQDCARHKQPPMVAFIEKKSTGVTLLSILKGMRGLKVREIERTRKSGSKSQRFIDIQPYVASKQVSLPAHGVHTEMCVNHMKRITNNDSHAHDDIADTCADAVRIALIDLMLIGYTHRDSLWKPSASKAINHFNKLTELKQKAYEKRN
jgi:predicted phage terminase large subunit-like protein